ncbi:tyrosine-protein phosphatase [Paenibacillus sp. GCM10012307]|uniref:Tyrosine-protein phosphatase n=1 Tax=Paenibacillus roseus TaxID=2798579 RepID=A0A934MNN8_9BACL|nr:tyrosine-protein phosphatase [Paenibacillus roseus]MBJ6360038.1 tyrosine-protein phosphatase [Paenibacillus roseus]
MLPNHQHWYDIESRANFRELGGYCTIEGKVIKRGLLFRSGELSVLNENDLELLKGLSLHYMIDLRTESEQQQKPTPDVGATIISLPALGGTVNPQEMFAHLKNMGEAANQGSLLLGAYKQFISSQEAVDAYKRFFDLLIAADGKPLLWHCTAGKDRTGFAAAILLHVLGVPYSIIKDDYLRSNQNRIEANKKWIAVIKQVIGDTEELQLIAEMMKVEPKYLDTAFEEAAKQYGSLDLYIEQALSLTPEKQALLKSIYLN